MYARSASSPSSSSSAAPNATPFALLLYQQRAVCARALRDFYRKSIQPPPACVDVVAALFIVVFVVVFTARLIKCMHSNSRVYMPSRAPSLRVIYRIKIGHIFNLYA